MLLARDRFGVKPLYYYKDENKLAFASELKALLTITGPLELNEKQIYNYFRLNYCAGEERIFKNVFMLPPGTYLKANKNGIHIENWYQVNTENNSTFLPELLEDAVKLRLHADVPVGSFLSGGLDSSIISALAAKNHKHINTFSIGFKNHTYLDESKYAEIVAKHIGSEHYSIQLDENDFIEHLDDFLNSIDEPFADSSAFNFYMLAKYSRKHVKVALSGDGADELFKGYLKHKAVLWSENWLIRSSSNLAEKLIGNVASGREGRIQNSTRKIIKLNQLSSLNEVEKQKLLASISNDSDCSALFKSKITSSDFETLFRNPGVFKHLTLADWFDLQVVLQEDMLVKVDRFSMRHGLEIRNPFLDYRVVEYALQLSQKEKINLRQQKIKLKQQFKHLLPRQIIHRPKKGFELPLKSWLSNQLKNKLETNWLNETKLTEQGRLNVSTIQNLKQKLFSNNPGDSAAKIWALVVFEHWLENYKPYIKTNA